MFAEIVAAVLFPLVLFYMYKSAFKKPDNFPPGPPSLPVYGAYFLLHAISPNNLAGAFIKLGRRYKTRLVGCYLGPFPAVVANGPALVKEVLNREEFDGRLDIILGRLRAFWKQLGIFFTDGYFWHTQRRFSLRYMRDFGFGRRCVELEDAITHEIKEMIDMRINGPRNDDEKKLVNGELVYLPHYLSVPFINGMLHVFSGMTLPRGDYPTLWDLARNTLRFQRGSNDLGGAISLTPWLKELFPKWSGYKDLYQGTKFLTDFFRKLIEHAMATHEDSHDRHFLDMYIRKMKEEIRDTGRTTFSVDQLILICTDYMFPSATAGESVIQILVEQMFLHPEIQDKIHEEIDRVVGRDRMPNLDDRKNMPYTEACLREMLRFETTVPLAVPHRCVVDTTLDGYHIAENTAVGVNLTSLHIDKDLWGDPEVFRPERFIKNGRLDVASDKSLPFGAGRRLCAGETYARQCMFQVFASFMQAFDVSTADGRPLTKPARRIQGIITTIPEGWVRVTPRI
ncbi:probable cytochrome P450 304a1 [Cydia splendana]|uniref:probable cytochrome P450 304a1 n=1 Tax=Cydia splendana TaxID=1100963 RepID=UPI0028F4B33A